MSEKLYLILENGKVFEGFSFGARGAVTGEVVFTTGMTGYLKTLTDKNHYGQIVVQTFPLIGNYGVIPEDIESGAISPLGYVVKHYCDTPSNFRSKGTIDAFLKERGIIGLYGVDTRALTKIIREQGAMNARISPTYDFDESIKNYRITDAVKNVSVKSAEVANAGGKYKVALIDYGFREGLRREPVKRGAEVTTFPHDVTASEILAYKPNGIILSNGPGDPAENIKAIKTIEALIASSLPIFGVGLGHQLLALAHGFRTYKLKYGHRGANQPVKNLITEKIYITSQNHGYNVAAESIDETIAMNWLVNVNDNTCEGIFYKDKPMFSVQFCPEVCGGPLDASFLFDMLFDKMEEGYAIR